MNKTPLFWLTTQYALLLSTFVALGRIFDRKSAHNIDRLIATASKDLTIYSKDALANRKRDSDLSAEEIRDSVSGAFEPKAADFEELRENITAQRRVYEARYRDVRNKVFAHNEVGGIDQANRLLAKTNVDETKALFAFLSELYEALWQLLHNGRKPELRDRHFILKPNPAPPGAQMLPGEKIYREGHAVLGYVVRGVEAEWTDSTRPKQAPLAKDDA